ncbi:MAG: ABC transporter permease [Patescibacteria group bacterium]|nr:ABC transporter permease [Patescibacteria group bacterium]
MKRRYIFILAFKNLKNRKLRTFLTMGGVALGIGFVVFLISLGMGLQRISTNEIANLEALSIMDVTAGKSKIITINDQAVEKIAGVGDIEKVAESVSLPARFELETSAIDGVLYGRNLDYIEMEDLKLEEGAFFKGDNGKDILINLAALNQLGVKDRSQMIGKNLKVSFTIRQDLLNAEAAKEETKHIESFKIVGIMKNDSAPYIYLPLETVKGYGVAKYTNLKVKVADKAKVDKAKQKIENLGFKVTAVKNTIDQINQFFSIFQFILLSFGLIAIIIASIGMFNTLTISLLEKTREIGFMKALGATKKDIYRIFLTETLLIGSAGGFLGIWGGYEVGYLLNQNIINLALSSGNKPVEIFYLPFSSIIFVFLFVFAISLLTGLYPSYRATRINALDALRYE